MVVVPPTPYPPNWNAEHRTWPFVREFILGVPWPGVPANDPVGSVVTELRAQNFFAVPQLVNPLIPAQYVGGPNTATRPLTNGRLGRQVLGVLNASIDRADRAGEIRSQASGPGALGYWMAMLRIDPATDTNTVLLMRVARRIGEFVAMGVKARFGMPRPAHVYPWIVPLIDGPDTPSYPSSHALQAHLISAALKLALPVPQFPPVWPPVVAPPPAPGAWPPVVPPRPVAPNETAQALDHLAYRVAYNREVAGVHYPWTARPASSRRSSCIFKLRSRCRSQLPALVGPRPASWQIDPSPIGTLQPRRLRWLRLNPEPHAGSARRGAVHRRLRRLRPSMAMLPPPASTSTPRSRPCSTLCRRLF